MMTAIEVPGPESSESCPTQQTFPPPVTQAAWDAMSEDQRRRYIHDTDPALEHLVPIELLSEAVEGVAEVFEPSRYEIEDEHTGLTRRKTADELHQASLCVSFDMVQIDYRRDPFAQTAAALRRMAGDLEAAAVRVEAARVECAELLAMDSVSREDDGLR